MIIGQILIRKADLSESLRIPVIRLRLTIGNMASIIYFPIRPPPQLPLWSRNSEIVKLSCCWVRKIMIQNIRVWIKSVLACCREEPAWSVAFGTMNISVFFTGRMSTQQNFSPWFPVSATQPGKCSNLTSGSTGFSSLNKFRRVKAIKPIFLPRKTRIR